MRWSTPALSIGDAADDVEEVADDADDKRRAAGWDPAPPPAPCADRAKPVGQSAPSREGGTSAEGRC